ncbi:acetyl-CoA acetyltransferase [Pseudorhodoferax sp.]|uniref:acetyl-CoA acetyltransferase n=1 Tax=Pseudorhodoferax sp. TaxID=1993553 RepID=UPI002DD66AE7|nr:acetyl-CoA acetyltransferase [Pseudorhodoferax sp.]
MQQAWQGHIVGWAHTRFGRLDGMDVEALVREVSAGALAHAGVGADEVDAIFVGHFNAGMVDDGFVSSMPLQAAPGWRFVPATRVENACASGSAAVYQALAAVQAGRARCALVVGVEKMTAVSGAQVTSALANASYVHEEKAAGLTFPGIFAQIAGRYFERHGDHSRELAMIAAKNHRNGVHNPYAQLRKDLGFEFCNTVSEKNPIVAAPLRKTDCSLVSDGAAALVIVAADALPRHARAVRFRAAVHVNDRLPISARDPVLFEGPAEAWRRAYREAGCAVSDLGFAEVHDCFTIAELLSYEAMGLAPAGQGGGLVREGVCEPAGRLPVNPSGGLKAKGHPVGATGVSMHVLAAMQLTGTAGDIQVPGATLGAVFNMGGAAVANYVSLLEAVKA